MKEIFSIVLLVDLYIIVNLFFNNVTTNNLALFIIFLLILLIEICIFFGGLYIYLKSELSNLKICYVGDGKNDFCPLTLPFFITPNSVAFVRKGYSLDKYLENILETEDEE